MNRLKHVLLLLAVALAAAAVAGWHWGGHGPSGKTPTQMAGWAWGDDASYVADQEA